MPPLWPVPREYSHATGLHEAAASAAITSDGHLVVEGLTQAGASKLASTATVRPMTSRVLSRSAAGPRELIRRGPGDISHAEITREIDRRG
eukprot:5697031-Prymnesium_polylepis.1